MKSSKVLHNVKCVECLVQGCRPWVDTDVALDKHGLSQVVSCSVSFPLEQRKGTCSEEQNYFLNLTSSFLMKS